MITSEDDVRAWVREVSGGKARWVEPALGSTAGLPDCWVPWAQVHSKWRLNVHIELKLGRIRDGLVRYKMRPEQIKQILSMVDEGVPVGLCIGIKNTRQVIFAKPKPVLLSGNWSMKDESLAEDWVLRFQDDERAWNEGVYFVFS